MDNFKAAASFLAYELNSYLTKLIETFAMDKQMTIKNRGYLPAGEPSMTRKRDLIPETVGNAAQFDEVVAGVFCSKRRTGQFNDRFETGELEYLSASATGSHSRGHLRHRLDDV